MEGIAASNTSTQKKQWHLDGYDKFPTWCMNPQTSVGLILNACAFLPEPIPILDEGCRAACAVGHSKHVYCIMNMLQEKIGTFSKDPKKYMDKMTFAWFESACMSSNLRLIWYIYSLCKTLPPCRLVSAACAANNLPAVRILEFLHGDQTSLMMNESAKHGHAGMFQTAFRSFASLSIFTGPQKQAILTKCIAFASAQDQKDTKGTVDTCLAFCSPLQNKSRSGGGVGVGTQDPTVVSVRRSHTAFQPGSGCQSTWMFTRQSLPDQFVVSVEVWQEVLKHASAGNQLEMAQRAIAGGARNFHAAYAQTSGTRHVCMLEFLETQMKMHNIRVTDNLIERKCIPVVRDFIVLHHLCTQFEKNDRTPPPLARAQTVDVRGLPETMLPQVELVGINSKPLIPEARDLVGGPLVGAAKQAIDTIVADMRSQFNNRFRMMITKEERDRYTRAVANAEWLARHYQWIFSFFVCGPPTKQYIDLTSVCCAYGLQPAALFFLHAAISARKKQPVYTQKNIAAWLAVALSGGNVPLARKIMQSEPVVEAIGPPTVQTFDKIMETWTTMTSCPATFLLSDDDKVTTAAALTQMIGSTMPMLNAHFNTSGTMHAACVQLYASLGAKKWEHVNSPFVLRVCLQNGIACGYITAYMSKNHGKYRLVYEKQWQERLRAIKTILDLFLPADILRHVLFGYIG